MSSSTKQISSEELLTWLKSKDEAAFDYLYKNYSKALYGIVCKVLKSEEFAEDVLQDSFIKIWNNIENYHPSKGSLFTWMLNITRNTSIDFTRSKFSKYQIQNSGELVDTGNKTESNNFDFIGVDTAINKLDNQYKEIINILYFQGFTQDEASKVLNIPLGTLKTRARAAILKLRELLKDNTNGH